MAYHKYNIEQFLLSRGWTNDHSGNLFEYFKPPTELRLEENYLLEIANDESKSGFQKYSQSLIEIINNIYNGSITEDDLNIFFSSEETVLSFRIDDEDTKNGSIQLERLS